MNTAGQAVQKHISRPNHPVPRRYVQPILYLADRMGQQDRLQPPPAKKVVDELAEMVKEKDFRRQPWYRQLNERKAVEMLDLETTKRAALVVMSLVMKLDTQRGDAAKQFFTRVREMMGAEAISVPMDVDEHRDIAIGYLVD